MVRFRRARDAFLGEEGADRPPDEAKAVVVPFGLEETVSYGGGTASGPEAIIAASPELEMFDEELWREPFRDFGVATLESPRRIDRPIAAALLKVESLIGRLLDEEKFPLLLGGEHSVTIGAVKAFAKRFPDLAVFQIDAHTDLRDGYRGERLSHAAAMRRVLDNPGVRLVSAGIRNISAEEAEFFDANRDRISIHWARERQSWDLDEMVQPLAGRPVYLTFDVDALDASLMPATGTPEPGGLSFEEATALIRAVSKAGRIVGADVVELAPIPELHACEFTAAKIAYKILTYALSSPVRTGAAA